MSDTLMEKMLGLPEFEVTPSSISYIALTSLLLFFCDNYTA